MFIENANTIESIVLLDGRIGKYLVSRGIPLLGFKDKSYVFSNTELVRHEIANLPWRFKIFLKKGGGEN